MDIIPRPWLTTEGTLNYQSLYQILTSVVSTINKHQTIKFYELHKLFSMVYSPVVLMDVLQVGMVLYPINTVFVSMSSMCVAGVKFYMAISVTQLAFNLGAIGFNPGSMKTFSKPNTSNFAYLLL